MHATPTLPSDLPTPYQLPVPRSAALTPASLALKNTFWPTVFAPRRKGEPEDWTRARAHWACTAMTRVLQEAHAARATGEVPSYYFLISPPLVSDVPALSSPSRRTYPHLPKSPNDRRTSHTTRVSRQYTRCGTPCSTLCARSPTRLPLLLHPLLSHRRCRYRRWRPLLTARARARAQLLA